jgi:peptide deformylase
MQTPIQIETEDATVNPAAANPNHDAIQLFHPFTLSGLAASRRSREERKSAAERAPVDGFMVHRGSRRSGGHDPCGNHRGRILSEGMVLPILRITGEDRKPLAVLRQTSYAVTEFNEELRKTVASMVETLFAANGVGLAAPQVGKPLNLFVMRMPGGIVNGNHEVRVVINPTVIEVSESVGTQVESCLSIPGISGRVTRFHEIGCVYWDENGQRHEESLEDLEARVYQHEFDHLLGTLFVDLADEFYRPNS